MTIEAMRQALTVLEEIADEVFSPYDNKLGDAITALRAAIEQAQANEFNPDWDAMGALIAEQQRMATEIEGYLTHLVELADQQPIINQGQVGTKTEMAF